jgi:hypothetical protein
VVLPLRLLGWILFLPFLLLKLLLGGIFLIVAIPIVAIVMVVGAIATVLAIAIPLLPFLALAGLAWVLYQVVRAPATAA